MPFAITDCRKASYYSDKLAKKSRKLPIVLTREEVKLVLTRLSGVKRLMGSLLHGSGLRLMEFVRLRVKDIDFSYHQIIVSDGKGHQDRVTMLPRAILTNSSGNILGT